MLAFIVRDAKNVIIPLDIVEVPDSHTGMRLAEEINRILEEFKVEDKVSKLSQCYRMLYLLC